jgi:exonuclease SbcC
MKAGLAERRAGLTARAAELAAILAGQTLSAWREKALAGLEREAERLAARLETERRIQSLAEHRSQLTAGQPCPLCGSLDHPYAAPEAEAERPAALDRLAAEHRAALDRAKRLVATAENLDREVLRGEAELEKTAAAVERGERLLAEAAAREAELAGLARQREELRRERAQVLFGADPEAEEKRLRAALAVAEKARAEAEKAREAAQAGHDALLARIAETTARLETLERDHEARTAAFQAELAAAGLADEAAYLAAALPPEERERLEGAARELTEAQAGLAARRRENAAAREREEARALTGRSLADLTAGLAALETERGAIQGRLGAIDQKLADYEQAALKYRELQIRIEAQGRECGRWDRLHDLIGSADGQKYRNFAQGLTFELMVHQANRQLAGLSDRYLLIRDPAQPLELQVIDNYQAGEIRSTKNLSGGESFLVSLALALGLSRLASRRVRVDSLFLDEGFGTLDEDALDLALETLGGLREDGKLIGVISHVSALIDRVPTQIRVRPLNGPHSAVSGPGVSGG